MSETDKRAGRRRLKASGKAARATRNTAKKQRQAAAKEPEKAAAKEPEKVAAKEPERAAAKELERVLAKEERADEPAGAEEAKPVAKPSAAAAEPAPKAAAAAAQAMAAGAAEAAGAGQRVARAQAAAARPRDLRLGFDEIVRFNQANLDAVMSTAGLAAEGARDVGRYLVEWQQDALRQGIEGMRQMIGAGSFPAALAVQADLARRGASDMLNRSAELSRLSAVAAGRAAEPLRSRTTAAAAALSRRAG